jgi:hypothetical protein
MKFHLVLMYVRMDAKSPEGRYDAARTSSSDAVNDQTNAQTNGRMNGQMNVHFSR